MYGAVHGHAALILYVTGLPWSPVSEENWPAIRPSIGVGVLRYKTKTILTFCYFILSKVYSISTPLHLTDKY